MKSDLASVYERIVAAMIDALPFLAVTIISRWKIPVGEKFPFFWFYYMFIVMIWLTVQAVCLTQSGQTIGKKAVKIRIVSAQTGENAGFITNVLKRSVLNLLLSLIPIYALVDVLFIFKDDRRCVHDLIAGTKVIRASNPVAA